jgi:hypothetical protein
MIVIWVVKLCRYRHFRGSAASLFMVTELDSGRQLKGLGQLYGKAAKNVAFQNNGKKRGDRSCTKAAEIVTVTLKVATACSSKTLVSQILSIC